MIRALVGLLAVAYLPGAVVFRLPVGDRDRRAQLDAGERAFWAIAISAAISSILALALSAASAYSFNRLLAADVTVAALGAIAARGRLRLRAAPRPSWSVLLPLALIAAAFWLYFPPAEYVMGGKDPGTYMNEGIQIAQRGGLLIHDPVVSSVPAATRDLFFPSHQNPAYYGSRFMGFFILDPGAGTVVGQFPHLYPVWIAVGYGLNGLTGARQTVGMWAAFGLLAVYFAGARLFGRLVAFSGTALLAVHVVQVWFGRYPNAEVLMQALLFAALLAWARAHVDGDPFFAPVAGVLLGLLLFLRFDAVLASAAVLVATLLGLLIGWRPRAAFLLPLGALGTAAFAYLSTLMRPYAARPFGFLRDLQAIHIAGLACGGLALLALTVLGRRERFARISRAWIPAALAVAAVVLAAYALFLRAPSGRLAAFDAYALRTFVVFYLSYVGFAAAVVGFALTARWWFWRDPAFFCTAFTFAAFFFYKIRIVPEQFWMARRFVPVILPAALLSIAAAAFVGLHRPPAADWGLGAGGWGLGRWRGGRATRGARLLIGVVFLALLGRWYVVETKQILHHVEYAGLIPRLEQLAKQFGDNDLVIVESRNSSDMHVLALPLAYIYARNVLVLASPRPDRRMFATFLEGARARYREVFFLGGGGTDLLSRTIGVAAVSSERFQIPEYASPREAYPVGVRSKEFDYGLYRFVRPPADIGWFALDVGTMDDLHVVRFHAKERTGADETVTFRWTRDVSYVSLTGLTAESRRLSLWLNDGRRPPSAPQARITLSIDETPIGQALVGSEFRPYTFSLPAHVASAGSRRDDPVRLKIESTTWNPRETLGAPDDRQLGVMLDRVEVR